MVIMGLDITGYGSEKDYHWGYGGIHQIRVLSLLCMKLDEKIPLGEIEKERVYLEGILHEHVDLLYAKKSLLRDWMYGKDYPKTERKFTDNDLKDFRQLIHFSDCEGILVPDWCLDDVNYSESYMFGSSTELLEELERLKDWIARNPTMVNSNESEIFFMLYDLVFDTVENGSGILSFH
jgi:hypothetical protein